MLQKPGVIHFGLKFSTLTENENKFIHNLIENESFESMFQENLDFLPEGLNLVIYELAHDGYWTIEVNQGSKFLNGKPEDGPMVCISFDTLKSVVFRTTDLSQLAINGSVKVFGIDNPQSVIKTLLKFLSNCSQTVMPVNADL